MLRTLFVAACCVAAMSNALFLDEVEGSQQDSQTNQLMKKMIMGKVADQSNK